MSVAAPEEPIVTPETTTVPPPTLLARLMRWYRAAVLDPATEQEQADWQQNSF